MSFSSENGYTPKDFQTLMDLFMAGVNTQFGTTYTTESFTGTDWYKYAYGWIQRLQLAEVKTSEIFIKIQEFFNVTNASISRPVVTDPGSLAKLEEEGFVSSIKPPLEADAGKRSICVDIDPDDYPIDGVTYAEVKDEINTLISQITSGGVVTLGTETTTIVLSNGQSFDYKFFLPTRIPVLLRLTTTLSENNQVAIDSPDDQKAKLLANILANYRLGKNFEPQRYFDVENDAPWASDVLLEWSDDDGANYYDTVFEADFDELFEVNLADVELIEN